MNALIATSPTSPTSPSFSTYCIDPEEKKDMIKRIEEIIYKDKKNQEAIK